MGAQEDSPYACPSTSQIKEPRVRIPHLYIKISMPSSLYNPCVMKQTWNSMRDCKPCKVTQYDSFLGLQRTKHIWDELA